MSRRDTQQAHERAQVAAFLAWFNKRYRANFQVIADPNPPEAIINSGRTKRWIEVTDAFWSDEYVPWDIDKYFYWATERPNDRFRFPRRSNLGSSRNFFGIKYNGDSHI